MYGSGDGATGEQMIGRRRGGARTLSGRRRRTILASCDGLGKWINGV
jgi:hypothetical protein